MLASYHHTWLGRHAMKPLGCETPLSWRCATIRINEEMAAAASWAAKLKLHNQKHPPAPKTEEERRKEDERLFEEEYTSLRGEAEKKYEHIPRFYCKPPRDDQVLQQKLREDARAVFLQRRGSELMDNEELTKLWSILEEKHTPPDLGTDEQMISYTAFLNIKDQVSDKCKPFFTAEVFTKLLRDDPYGRVSVSQLFSYIMRKVWLQQTRIGLSLFDIQGLGYLKESDLENYILELIPTLPQLNCLEESFYSFYVCTAVRKFFFFLDPLRTGGF
ncbi:Serine/threonine-protein phosphatase 2A regulatory subunit B'' subunit gamma [Geodia barretti]|uniref:Serine/threonine-protein phosphatase 2A regulatory subunit B'' subunit gamma n=1 Tax=Geodia barretti TaxID=519541 RepID=A0AA35SIA0_GEOBA|nr:Serine/threonine-protein phosphatase 2A regulatory subunit B'' subunit gamma [Geodia barretti]